MAFLQPDEYSMDFVSKNLTQGSVETHFSENADAAFDHALQNVSLGANKWFYNSNHSDIGEEQLTRMRLHNSELSTYRDLNRESLDETTPNIDKFNQSVNDLKNKKSDEEWLTYQEIADKAKRKTIDDANAAEHTYKDISGRSSFGGSIGGLVGFLGGTMADPVNLGLLVATAPFALESLPAAIFGNALINTAYEGASQFTPGGQRDWARERGLSDQAVNDETKAAMFMAPVGGGVFGGLIHGAGKGIGAILGRLNGDSPLAARAALDELKAHRDRLSVEAQDNLKVIESTQRIEDIASADVLSSRVTGVDQKILQQNINDLNAISQAMITGDKSISANVAKKSLDLNISIIDNVIKSIREGVATKDDIAAAIKLLPEDAQGRYNARVSEIQNGKQKTSFDAIAETERLLKEAETLKTKVETDNAKASEQLTKMRDMNDRLVKEVSDHEAILNDLNAKKAEIEKSIVDLHDGKFGDIKEQVDAIHVEFMKNLEQVKKDIDAFQPEYLKAQKAADDFKAKLDKAERRAGRDTESRKQAIDTNTRKQIERNASDANMANRAEYDAAIEALSEQRTITENKVAWANLLALNPKTDISRLRELIGFRELVERKKNGELISESDFLETLSVKEKEILSAILDKAKTTEEGLARYIKRSEAKIKEEGIASIDHISKNIDSIMESFHEGAKPIDIINKMSEGNHSIGSFGKAELDRVIKMQDGLAHKADIEIMFMESYNDALMGLPRNYGDRSAPVASIGYNAGMHDRQFANISHEHPVVEVNVDKQDAIINENINSEMAHPLTGEKTTADAVSKEIDNLEWKADFIDQCSRGGV